MDREQAIHSFWSGFGLKAFDENTVPDNAMMLGGGKYITYNVATSSFEDRVPLYANLWYKSPSWAQITQKANQISEAIGMGGKLIPFDGGYIWICRGVPFSQRMADDQSTIRRIYINVMAEFISVN